MLFVKKPGVSWLVVFLGNPGREFEGSRHNAGFLASSFVERSKGVRIDRLKFRALTCRCELGGEGVLLMKPQTYMNLSGDAVKQAADFYRLAPERVIVVSDDVALPCGKLRVRRGGSDGGQKGLRSIRERLGSEAFPRVKIGVGAPPRADYELKDWVLSRPAGEDARVFAEAAERAAEAVEYYIRHGADMTMNKYN